MQHLWEHALTTAYLTEALTNKAGIESDIAFLAGLLHDIGKVVLVDTITTKFTGSAGRLKDDLNVLTKAVSPLNATIGLHVAQHWRLSTDLQFAIYYANDPKSCPKSELQKLVHCVSLACTGADSAGCGLPQDSETSQIDEDALSTLGLGQPESQKILDDTRELTSALMPSLHS